MTVQTSLLPGEPRLLGISAKSLHKISAKKPKSDYDKLDAKAMRYALQRQSQRIMYDRDSLKQHRVCSCGRDVAGDGVNLYRAVDGSDARYSNLMTCGSVWACPICAAKVTEKRRADLQQAIKNWVGQHPNYNIVLLTLTFPHESWMDLAELLERFAVALQAFKNSRTYKGIFGTPQHLGEFERVGSVRSLEVTHGVNGWHPHTHDLVFLKKQGLLNSAKAIDELKGAWAKACLKAGLGGNSRISDMFEHGLDIRGGDYSAEYVAKFGHEPKLYDAWSAASEVTKQHSKIGGGEHSTPFMLLKWASDGDDTAAALFKEFVDCFDGKRMNYWSPNLRKTLSLGEELTDDELAADEPEAVDEELVIRLDVHQWHDVLKRNQRVELLRAARLGAQAVFDFLDELPEKPVLNAGYFKDRARPYVSRFFH